MHENCKGIALELGILKVGATLFLQGSFLANRLLWVKKEVFNIKMHFCLNRISRIDKVVYTKYLESYILKMGIQYTNYGIPGYGVSRPGIQNKKDFCIKINISKKIIEFWEF